MAAGRSTSRFDALDLLRGLAAIAVLIGHFHVATNSAWTLDRSYLGVDLFFVLSGFVLSHAFHDRLRTTSEFRQYCVARLVRLYPLYLAAVVTSAALLLLFAFYGAHGAASPRKILLSLVTGLLLLPTPRPWSIEPRVLFALVFTAWSLFWEVIVNLAYGATARRLGRRSLLATLAIAGLGCVVALGTYGDLEGWDWDTAWVAFPRAFFSFFAGVAIFQIRRKWRAPAVPASLLGAVLMVLLKGLPGGPLYVGACVFVLFPLLVWFAADASQSAAVRRTGVLLGFLSYPIYLMQAPLALAAAPLQTRAALIFPNSVPVDAIIYFGVIILGSWLIAWIYDTPVRTWLRRRFLSGVAVPKAQAAP